MAGSVLHGVVSPPVPYRMRIGVELVRCVPHGAIDAVVHGDLEGTPGCACGPAASGPQAEVAWSVEMMQRPMRLASVFTRPILQWGHDRVVEMTVAGFKRQLAVATGTGPLSGEPGHGQGGGQEHDAPRHRPQRLLERGQQRALVEGDHVPSARATVPPTTRARRRSIRAGVLRRRWAADRAQGRDGGEHRRRGPAGRSGPHRR